MAHDYVSDLEPTENGCTAQSFVFLDTLRMKVYRTQNCGPMLYSENVAHKVAGKAIKEKMTNVFVVLFPKSKFTDEKYAVSCD